MGLVQSHTPQGRARMDARPARLMERSRLGLVPLESARRVRHPRQRSLRRPIRRFSRTQTRPRNAQTPSGRLTETIQSAAKLFSGTRAPRARSENPAAVENTVAALFSA